MNAHLLEVSEAHFRFIPSAYPPIRSAAVLHPMVIDFLQWVPFLPPLFFRDRAVAADIRFHNAIVSDPRRGLSSHTTGPKQGQPDFDPKRILVSVCVKEVELTEIVENLGY